MNLSSQAKVRSTRIRKAWMASLKNRFRPRLVDVGDQARIENALPIVRGIKAPIEVEVGASEVQPDLFGHLLQRLQTLRKEYHICCIDGSHWDRR